MDEIVLDSDCRFTLPVVGVEVVVEVVEVVVAVVEPSKLEIFWEIDVLTVSRLLARVEREAFSSSVQLIDEAEVILSSQKTNDKNTKSSKNMVIKLGKMSSA